MIPISTDAVRALIRIMRSRSPHTHTNTGWYHVVTAAKRNERAVAHLDHIVSCANHLEEAYK